MRQRKLIDGLTTDRLLAMVDGLPPSTLDYWVLKGLVSPSVRAEAGHRVARLWSLQDVIAVRTVRALREAGCPLQRIRDALDTLRTEWDATLSSSVLYWSGSDLHRIATDGAPESVWRNKGQLLFPSMAQLPIGNWRQEYAEQSKQYLKSELIADRGRGAYPIDDGDGDALRQRRRKRYELRRDRQTGS